MALLRVSCIIVCSLSARSLLSDLKWLNLDVVAVSETRVVDMCNLTSILGDFEIFASLSRSGMEGGVTVALVESLHLKIRSVFLDLEGNSMVLSVNDIEGSGFRLVAVYPVTRSRQMAFFRHLAF